MARPSSPLLTRERIRTAALAMIDRDGLDGLSMRRLAADLGVRAASLYGYLATKDELLTDLADDVLTGVDSSGFSEGWRHGLTVWARSYREALAAHPNLVPFLAHSPGRRPQALRHADAVHGGLTSAGWPARYATMIGASTKYLVVGAAMTSFSGGFADDVEVYVGRYPNLSQAHLLAGHEEIDRDSFELALTAFLDGLSRLHEQVARHDSEPGVRSGSENPLK
ncbi:TetR/AcrR family transcriptional regulator [Cryptosporangium aurantiacum]|uniref:Transcriptional regulator, TetR family n=1 Tax=Cryptosporangium aurantiacum TaxID=134849 RepID=A0A1M7MRZ3_9ACTN|nr:TetR/AcrR family transcriptional regulator C-terminal domain-containing protein [Cryptosporangium aurantiacum]SHM93733.1 transcriptional regulator, TetR family [Cryptosporangium aurantiacum]